MLNTESQSEEYFERMKKSINSGGKQEIVNRIKQGNVLDLGCGDGSLAIRIKQLYPQTEVYAVDLNEKGKSSLMKEGVKFFKYDLSNFNRYEVNNRFDTWMVVSKYFQGLKGIKFDTIILSSVIHEILSYSDHAYLRINDLFTTLGCMLKKNGKILIREGARCGNSDVIRHFNLKVDQEKLERLKYNIAEFLENNIKRFNDNYYSSSMLKVVATSNTGEVVLATTNEILQELLFTLNWGEKSWEREHLERNYFITKEDLKAVLKRYINGEVTFEALEYDQNYYKNISKAYGIEVSYPTMQFIEYTKRK